MTAEKERRITKIIALVMDGLEKHEVGVKLSKWDIEGLNEIFDFITENEFIEQD